MEQVSALESHNFRLKQQFSQAQHETIAPNTAAKEAAQIFRETSDRLKLLNTHLRQQLELKVEEHAQTVEDLARLDTDHKALQADNTRMAKEIFLTRDRFCTMARIRGAASSDENQPLAEISSYNDKTIKLNLSRNSTTVSDRVPATPRSFSFDHVFSQSSSSHEIFRKIESMI